MGWQKGVSSCFQEKIASYMDEDASTAEDSTIRTLMKSFEQKAREYGIKKMLRGMMVAFEQMPDNEDFEHSAGLSELDGDDSTAEDEDTVYEAQSTEDESTEDGDVGAETASGIGSDKSKDTFGAGHSGKGSADEPQNGGREMGKRALPYRPYIPPKASKKGQKKR
ncbi:uncharacterized protein A1O5_00490 [Cladophialophora psammophila CBS 110553]|uniref:Uncharacterized protein n=1 Tax=Cladophialophora psammophila CBS 110553 TaxID=1182543 RepID=W9X683_9EURO|nr:uncharacterized protein A1O5_00490 [Cladophialophora psammophila CBS 110553]EXJ75982.1 hypothetical protein A1O5_00490 [Cladophialophora psammophila CBS 110553]